MAKCKITPQVCNNCNKQLYLYDLNYIQKKKKFFYLCNKCYKND